jgi:diguanylate cyclase (GGDEF)-like protein
MNLLNHRARQWILILLGFFLFSGSLFWHFHPFTPHPGGSSVFALLLCFYSLFILVAWIYMRVLASTIMAVLSTLVIFAFACLEGSTVLIAVIPIILLVYAYCVSSGSWIEGDRMAMRAQIEQVEGEDRLLSLEYRRQRELSQGLRRKFNRYVSLKEATEIFGSTLSEENLCRLIVKSVLETIEPAQSCLLYLVDDATHDLTLVSHAARDTRSSIYAKQGNILDRWVLKNRRPLRVEDLNTEFRFRRDEMPEEDHEWRSVLACALVTKHSVSGVIRVNAREPNVFSADDLRLLDILGSLASVAVQNAKLYKRTEELAIRDGLTGLYVHRYFQERLVEEHQRALTSRKHLCILMCDLDHFKSYNDRYGHTAGDQLLKQIGRILMKGLAPGELVARYGGEEFALLLPGVSKKGAGRRAEEIRKQVGSEIFQIRREKTYMSISIGVACFPDDALDRQALLRKADEALYEAKRGGRDRVCLSS